MEQAISLAEALHELREELYAAQDEGADQQIRFEVERAELTLEVEFRRDANGKVKVDVGALGAKVGGEGGGGVGTTRRQTLTLALQVRDEALGGERARIRRAGAGAQAGAGAGVPGMPGGGLGSEPGSGDGDTPRPWER
ncbi:trypco2 family protein [Streptomyces sp. NPDC048717]|uniref:trypco2 family protein n=1 Tax=Streptomyces sp. NPDC048717 TaxID=3154928 RepID=UPI00344A27DD